MDISYLDQWEEKLRSLNEEISQLHFKRYMTKENFPQLKELENKRAVFMNDKKVINMVTKFKCSSDPLLSKKIEILRRQFLLSSVNLDPEIMELNRTLAEKVVYYKYQVNGELVELGKVKSILRQSDDVNLRKEAYLSYGKQSQELKDDLLKLVKLRNKKAKEKGYHSYVELVLDCMGLTEDTVVTLLGELTLKTQSTYQEVLSESAKKHNVSEIKPWDVQYLLENYGEMKSSLFPKEGIAPALEKWINSFGYTLKDLGIEVVYTDIPYNGLCMGIKKGEVKLLANPHNGFPYYQTMFHELGHGLHSSLMDVPSLLFRSEASVFSESMAEVFGFVPHSLQWLKGQGLSEEQGKQILKSALGPKLFYLRQRTAYALFEYKLYRDPDGNIDKMFGDTESDILCCQPDFTPRWAANPWFISFPVYWQNYVIADIIAAQIHNHLNEEYGPLVESLEAFNFVIENYIKPGGTIPWLEKIERNTGDPLCACFLIDMINRNK